MGEERFPARLHVLVALEASEALVIRRGPSKHCCVLRWDRRRDEFTVAQWLKGRIYERRADISPDGRHWIYFAMNGQWQSDSKGSWTAVARTPWLKAIEWYPKGDCWQGGGLFLDNRRYWLNGHCERQASVRSREVQQDPAYSPGEYYSGECPGVYYHRLQRDGWQLQARDTRNRLDASAIFIKTLPGGWQLLKHCHEQVGAPQGKSCYWDEHGLIAPDGSTQALPNWEWAEWIDDRLIYAESGCLFDARFDSRSGIGEAQLLHDFNGYQFQQTEAPY